MMRYAAFLRGVNLGKRTVKSAELRTAFELMGMTGVKTLLASGNVLFDTPADDDLQKRIEAGLREQFKFEVPVVLRTRDELQAMVAANPFGRAAGEDAQLHVLLFDRNLPKATRVPALAGDYDVAKITAREIFFIIYRKDDGTYLGRSKLSLDGVIPKGHVGTMRNWNTILKAVA